MTTVELPKEYTPYPELEFCSNFLVNTPIALEVEGNAPVLIGSGRREPRIWLSAVVGEDRRQHVFVVRDGKPRFPNVTIEKKPDGGLEVSADSTKLLAVSSKDRDHATVSYLDLRPLGFNIHGDRDALWVGGSQFSGNSFKNCRTGIGVGS